MTASSLQIFFGILPEMLVAWFNNSPENVGLFYSPSKSWCFFFLPPFSPNSLNQDLSKIPQEFWVLHHFPLIFPSFSLVFVPKMGEILWKGHLRRGSGAGPGARGHGTLKPWETYGKNGETMEKKPGKMVGRMVENQIFRVFQPQKWGMNMNGSVSLWNWSFEPSNSTNLHQQELNFFTLKNGDSSTTWD